MTNKNLKKYWTKFFSEKNESLIIINLEGLIKLFVKFKFSCFLINFWNLVNFRQYQLMVTWSNLDRKITHDLRYFLEGKKFNDLNKTCKVYIHQDILKNPENELYQIVVFLYLANYYRYHSQADWQVLKRRYFRGEELHIFLFEDKLFVLHVFGICSWSGCA